MLHSKNTQLVKKYGGLLTLVRVLLAFGALSLPSAMATSKLSPDLQKLPPSASVDVIVQFRSLPTGDDVAKLAAKGGKLKRGFTSIKGGLFTLPARALSAVAAEANVTYVSPDRKVEGKLEFAQATTGANFAFQYGWTGYGVGVAVIDSGIYFEHTDLKPRVVYAESFVPGDTRVDDMYGHGTHVANIIGGNGTGSTGPSYTRTFRGIAPKSNLINLRALDSSGNGTDSSVINAIDRAIELKSTYGIRIINLSLGRTVAETHTLDPLCQAVERAWKAGLVVVVAAGNNGRDNSMGTNGYATITSPGNSPYVITVGSMKHMNTMARGDDEIASYSSKGPTLLDQIVKPDLVAPGNHIVSALAPNASVRERYFENVVPVSYYKSVSTTNLSTLYFRLSGTSMAAPMVSGAAALLLQKNAALTPDQVKARLMKTASKSFPSMSVSVDALTGATYQSTYDLFTIGAGYLDIEAALNNNELSSGPALSPKVLHDADAGATSLVFEPGSVWDNAVIWGTAVVWGTNVIVEGTAVVWGTAVIWGTSTSQGFAVVWGTTVVWGTDHPFPEAVAVFGDK